MLTRCVSTLVLSKPTCRISRLSSSSFTKYIPRDHVEVRRLHTLPCCLALCNCKLTRCLPNRYFVQDPSPLRCGLLDALFGYIYLRLLVQHSHEALLHREQRLHSIFDESPLQVSPPSILVTTAETRHSPPTFVLSIPHYTPIAYIDQRTTRQ